MQQTTQSPTITALATLTEQRGAARLVLSEALAANTEVDQWARDIALLESAKAHFEASHFEEASRVCDGILDATETDTGSPFRGRALHLLAESKMALGLDDDAQDQIAEWLEEAQGIFNDARDPGQIGRGYRLQGALAYWQGELEKGSEMITAGSRLERAFVPELTGGRADRHVHTA